MDLKDVSRNEINKRRNDKMNETFKDKSFMEGKPMNMLDLSVQILVMFILIRYL